MRNTITTTQVERFREIIGEIKELIDEAKSIVRDGPEITYQRAKTYPFGHICSSLNGDSDYVGEDCTLETIADELETVAAPAPTCKKCGIELDEDGFCTDEACPYYDDGQDAGPEIYEPKTVKLTSSGQTIQY